MKKWLRIKKKKMQEKTNVKQASRVEKYWKLFLRTISQNTEKTVYENTTENRDRTDSDLNPTTQPFYLYSLMKLLHHSWLHQISYSGETFFFFFFLNTNILISQNKHKWFSMRF